MTISEQCRRDARAVRQIHQMFLEEFRRNIPATYIISFMLVIEEEGLSLNDYAERSGIEGSPKSVMSRILLDGGDGKPGLGLVTSRPRPDGPHAIILTAKGREMAERISEILHSKGD